MKPFKGKISEVTVCRKEYKIVTNDKMSERYWDEGKNFYPRYKAGYVNPNKRLEAYQMRMFRTWKNNRKTQWKDKRE